MDAEDFIEPVSDEFICGICIGVMEAPVCCKRGHCWCRSCIETWISSNETCPSDGLGLKKDDLSDLRPLTSVSSFLFPFCCFLSPFIYHYYYYYYYYFFFFCCCYFFFLQLNLLSFVHVILLFTIKH
jgi:hypothetical protein